MTPKLPVVRTREVIRVAEELDFVFDRQTGSHAVYFRARDRARVVIPIHQGRDLKTGTLRGIIRDLGITVEEFRRLL